MANLGDYIFGGNVLCVTIFSSLIIFGNFSKGVSAPVSPPMGSNPLTKTIGAGCSQALSELPAKKEYAYEIISQVSHESSLLKNELLSIQLKQRCYTHSSSSQHKVLQMEE